MNKMIVLDLDGTLLRDDKTVSKETIDILLKFKSAGNEILFATARPPRDAYKYVPDFEINDKLYSNFDTSDFFGKAPSQIVDLENLEFNNVIVCSKNKITQKVVENLPNSCKGIITDNGKLCQIMSCKLYKNTILEAIGL